MQNDNSIKDQSTRDSLRHTQRLATIIWAALLASLGVYVVVVVAFKEQISFATLESGEISALRLVMVVVAGIVLAITPQIYSRVLASAYRRRNSSEENALSAASSTYMTALIVVMALYESIGIYGLVLVLVGAGNNTFIGFMGVSAVAMLTARPKMETLLEHYSKAL